LLVSDRIPLRNLIEAARHVREPGGSEDTEVGNTEAREAGR
jgi:hypothetical protein